MDACFAGADIGSEIAALTAHFCTAEMLKVKKFVTRIVDGKGKFGKDQAADLDADGMSSAGGLGLPTSCSKGFLPQTT